MRDAARRRPRRRRSTRSASRPPPPRQLGLHRPRRRHRRAGGVPARARVSAALPRAHGAPVLSARIRAHAGGFPRRGTRRVRAERQGEHLLLTIEKRGMNTAFAAKRIAAVGGHRRKWASSYAGLKDRHAVTRQRFSVHLPKRDRAGPGARCESRRPARARSRPGTRASCRAARWPAIASCWCCARCDGERDGDRSAPAARSPRAACRTTSASSASAATATTSRKRWRCSPGAACGASSARCCCRRRARQLFNRVLARAWPTAAGTAALDGEVWMLDGSRSVFGPEPFDDALARAPGARSTSIRPGRCGARRVAHDGDAARRWRRRRWPTRNRSPCAPAWKPRA